ncbi:MAG: hypothetical protein FWE29_07065 [Defluviitaleaceae bacterium]|nr:hypothetical protein [Defluviitaleaceae bacterium]
MVKHVDENLQDHFNNFFDRKKDEQMTNAFMSLTQSSNNARMSGYAPGSEQVQVIAKEWWDFFMDAIGGDMNMLPNLLKFGSKIYISEQGGEISFDKKFIGEALEIYCASIGCDLSKFYG